MTLRHPLAAALVLAAVLAASPARAADAPARAADAPAPAAAPRAVSAAYAANLRTIMDGMAYYEDATNIAPLAGMKGVEREFVEAFQRQVTREELYRRLQPLIAHVVDERHAAALAPLVGAPVFRKRILRARVAPATVSYGSSFFTAAEADELRRIDRAPALAEWRAALPGLNKAIGATCYQWGVEVGRQVAARTADAIRQVSLDLAAAHAAAGPGAPVTVTFGRVGVPSMDKMVAIAGASLVKLDAGGRRLDGELDRLGFSNILQPAWLESKSSRAISRGILDKAEEALDAMLANANAAIKERDAALRVVAVGMGDHTAAMDRTLGAMYGYYLDFGEGNRRVLDQCRRVLAFFDARQDSLHLVDGRVVFNTDADLATARELLAGVDSAKADLRKLVADQGAREDSAMDKAHGIAPPRAPVSVPAPAPAAASSPADAGAPGPG